MEPPERATELPVDLSQSLEGSAHQLGSHSESRSSSQEQLGAFNGGLQRLAFQDSNLSPALSLLPVNTRPENNLTEYSLLQESDTEFAPLRPYPDVSMASVRFHTTQGSELEPLSQHPLTQTTTLSEEGVSSSGSLSQHSLSPGVPGRREVTPAISSKGHTGTKKRKPEMFQDMASEVAKDETFFLRKDVSAQHLLDLLQKDVGLQSSTSSAVSSASETSVKSTASFTKCGKSIGERQGPSGEASLPQQPAQQPDRVLNPGQSQARLSEVGNITMGPRSPRPDDSSEALRRELLSEVERRSSCEDGSEKNQQETPMSSLRSTTPKLKDTAESKTSGMRTNVGGVPYTGPFSAAVERIQRETDLWSSGNQTGIDGSYLSFLPQSQSTPGVFKVPTRSGVKPKLSAIESSKDNSHETSSGVSQQPAVPVTEPDHSDTASQHPKDATEVQSLPSLTYMQKVDAWRANQSSGKTSLFDSLALQGFSGVSPKKKAYDAVSDSLSRILSQQARSLQQPLLSSATNQRVPQSVSAAPSGSSSPRRGEAVGSAPSEKDNTGSAAPPSISPFGRSQSHSSLNTVVMSVNKEQQTDGPPEQQEREDDSPPLPPPPLPPPPLLSSTVQPPMSLSHFSDVSLDQDLTMSSSQESYSDVKKQASIGASSVVSLEIDNYAPYWTSKLSTPPPLPRPRELNIDERIPLYLHNLGIDQSPSAILTPFAPRGPIREPEFSPTDLYTLKGSTGTPARSTQPSEGGSPNKGEFSRSSILSVDSSASMTFSLDSLGAAASGPEQQSSRLTSNQTTKQPADELTREETNLKSLLQTSVIVDQATEDSFVSSKALVEIQELLSHAENVMLTSSSASSSAPPTARQLLPDEDSSTSLNKRSLRLQDSSFSSSFTSGDPRTPTSLLWTRSSSDSMLMSDKQRQRSVGQENTSVSRQPDYPLTQAPNAAPAVAPHQSSQDNDGAATSLILSKSVRRTEPEGCSAAPPASAPNPPVATSPPPAASAHQLPSSPEDTEEVTEEEKRTAGGPTQSSSSSSSSSSPAIKDADQEDLSDASSQSSLAVRVAKLLQSESPATMVSSTPSTTDQEDGKDWIKVKTSGQQTETQKLNREDRKRIEEIKRELLLKNPFKSQSSTDTESSSAFSFKVPKGHDVLQPAAPSDANDQPVPSLHSSNPADSVAASTNFIPPDLEAQVCEIAAREGVILPPKKPRALTSITIATCRRSTSPSPSTSPAPPHSPSLEPLLLTELSSSQPPSHSEDEDKIPWSAHEPNRSLIAISQPAPGNQRRQDTLGGQHEDPPPGPSEDMSIQDDTPQAFERPQGESQAAKSSTRTGHISRVHLILSPKSPSHSPTPSDPPSHHNAASGPPRKDFVPLRQSSPAASSPDEGVGLTSPPEWLEAREPPSRRAAERSDASTLYKPAVPQGKMADTPAQFATAARHRVERPVNTEVPALLPYKPHGSEEFFYVPQTEADVSSAETTMESSHTGSDDAVPPRFSSEVLGQQDPGLDRGVTIRHTEGIYSKRLKTATFKMQEAKLRDATDASERSSPTSVSQAPKPSTQVSVAFTRVPSPGSREVRRRDRGTSPIQFLSDDPPEPLRDRFHAVPVVQTSRGRQLPVGDPDLRRAASQQSSLDQLWRRFCLQWAAEESHAASDREASLLERLERLSRLIHSKRSITMPGTQEEEVEEDGYHPGTKLGHRRQEQKSKETKGDVREVRRSSEFREQERKAERGRKEQEETLQPPADDSRTSSFSSSGFSHSSSHSQLLSTADRNESDDLSSTSASLSTVDTARLIRVFGVHKVQHMKSNSSLSKLYGAIDKQKEQRGQRRDKPRDPPPVITPSDQSLVADSSSSASTYTVPSRHGPSRTLVAKRTVKLVNKGIQAGDLEIVHNGTRRHTRDVGTTFPSPRVSGLTASRPLGAERERGAQRRSSSKGHSVQKQKKNKRSPSKPFPAGVSWFISADNLSSAARKENQPEERPSAAWFEPYSRERPWRQPLRQRHVQEDGDTEPSFTRHAEVDPDPRSKTLSDVLTRVSLQEALEVCRPGFISRSRQRVERLALQVEERKLQAAFSRERDELFHPPGGRERLHRPAGTAQLRRAVPRKEMIQRSKQIYNKLPEVQRRREEERRRAEYSSYRLNAQLYNKRITNHVLGRRSAWQ